ncbi:hypothetical protein HMPREF9552_01586, partial [Escherichia coli MS 198-1]
QAVQFLQNNLQHRLLITINLVIPETQHGPALRLKPASAPGIIGNCQIMLPTIQLNYYTRRAASKIENVAPHRMLTAKFEITKTSAAKISPELSFLRSEIAS